MADGDVIDAGATGEPNESTAPAAVAESHAPAESTEGDQSWAEYLHGDDSEGGLPPANETVDAPHAEAADGAKAVEVKPEDEAEKPNEAAPEKPAESAPEPAELDIARAKLADLEAWQGIDKAAAIAAGHNTPEEYREAATAWNRDDAAARKLGADGLASYLDPETGLINVIGYREDTKAAKELNYPSLEAYWRFQQESARIDADPDSSPELKAREKQAAFIIAQAERSEAALAETKQIEQKMAHDAAVSASMATLGEFFLDDSMPKGFKSLIENLPTQYIAPATLDFKAAIEVIDRQYRSQIPTPEQIEGYRNEGRDRYLGQKQKDQSRPAPETGGGQDGQGANAAQNDGWFKKYLTGAS